MKKKKQIQEDLNFAKQLAVLDVCEAPKKTIEKKKEVSQATNVSACSSKTADFIDSLMLQDETISTCDDDKRIAELLQAEFDLEYDEEIKKLEKSRNKSMYGTIWNFTMLY